MVIRLFKILLLALITPLLLISTLIQGIGYGLYLIIRYVISGKSDKDMPEPFAGTIIGKLFK